MSSDDAPAAQPMAWDQFRDFICPMCGFKGVDFRGAGLNPRHLPAICFRFADDKYECRRRLREGESRGV